MDEADQCLGITMEFIPDTGASKREMSSSVAFGFERRKSENSVTRRRALLTSYVIRNIASFM